MNQNMLSDSPSILQKCSRYDNLTNNHAVELALLSLLYWCPAVVPLSLSHPLICLTYVMATTPSSCISLWSIRSLWYSYIFGIFSSLWLEHGGSTPFGVIGAVAGYMTYTCLGAYFKSIHFISIWPLIRVWIRRVSSSILSAIETPINICCPCHLFKF